MMGSLIDSLGAQVVQVLAVAGGGALGWVGAGLTTKLLGRLVSRRPVPRPALLLVRVLGGTALGLAVYLLIFGTGGPGWGLGGPGGWVLGGRGSQGNRPSPAPGSTGREPPDAPPRPSVPEKLSPATANAIRVHIIPSKLYGERMDNRFYRIEGEAEYRTLPEVADRIEELRRKNPDLNVAEIITFRNSIAEREGLVAKLAQRLQQPGLTVKTMEVAADAP